MLLLTKKEILGRNLAEKKNGEAGQGQPTAGIFPALKHGRNIPVLNLSVQLNYPKVTREGHFNTINLVKVTFNIAGSMRILLMVSVSLLELCKVSFFSFNAIGYTDSILYVISAAL